MTEGEIKICNELHEINKLLKNLIESNEQLFKLFSKYDESYLIEVEKEKIIEG